jgi:hypothetical protein
LKVDKSIKLTFYYWGAFDFKMMLINSYYNLYY